MASVPPPFAKRPVPVGGAPTPLTRVPSARAGRVGWILFDWAQQPFNALVAGFVFGPWFVTGFVGDPVEGQALYGWAAAASGALIAVLSPLVGALIDARGNHKTALAALLVPFVLGCCGLWLAAPGARALIPVVMACLVVATVATELSFVAANAMLPGLAEPGRLGRLSGTAWALGYAAALVALGLHLALFAAPEEPLLGLDKAAGEPSRVVGPLVAAWFAIFALPLFLLTPSPPRAAPGRRAGPGLRGVLGRLRRDRGMAAFLAGRMLLGDGVNTAGTFGPVIAAGLFGWTAAESGAFGVLLASVAGVSAFLAGRLDDRLGSKRVVLGAAAILLVGVGGIGLVGPERLLLAVPVAPPAPGDGLFASPAERLYLVFGALIGIAFGPVQASLRAWMARLAPPGEEGLWFGLFSTAGRATAFAAPALVALLTAATGDPRAAVPVVILFLVAGAALLALAPAGRAGAPGAIAPT